MAPATAIDESNALVIPTSESDMVSSAQGSRRKYAGAIALFALVAVIVGGVGMHRHSVHSNGQDAEIGDIIEATGNSSSNSSSSNSTSNNTATTVGATAATTVGPAAGTTPAPNSVAADGSITSALVSPVGAGAASIVLLDATGISVGCILCIGSETFTVVSITFLTRRLTEGSRRLSASATVTFTPATSQSYPAGTSVTAQSQAVFDLNWWASHGQKFAHAGQAFPDASAAAKAQLSAMTTAAATTAAATTAAPAATTAR